jgi:hypothetical protein
MPSSLLCATMCMLVFLLHTSRERGAVITPPLMPWQSIGGCGAGGSGGGSKGIRWVGEGVSGGRFQLEVLPKINFGQNYLYSIAEPQLSCRTPWNTELALSMPFGTKCMEVQYQTNMDQELILNGGRGDLSCDLRQTLGNTGQYAVRFSLTFPTGHYDAQRGNDQSKSILPQNLQMGRGVYSGTLGLSYTRDSDNGMLLFNGYFDYPFMVRLDKKNKYLSTDYRNYASVTGPTRTRFYYKYAVKPYGESDRGDYYPPSLSVDAIYAYRGLPKLVQSFQLFFAAPMGVRWIHSYNPALYAPLPDPENRAWDLVLGYGMEISRDLLPFFLGIGLPIHDKQDPLGKWNSPAWEMIGQEWIIAMGFKAAMF